MKLYKIKNWDILYENHETRKLKNLKFILIPNKHDGLGYKKITRQKDAPEIFAAFILMLELASKCPKRGQLSQDFEGNLPLSPGDMGDKTGFTEIMFLKAIPFLVSQCQWVEEIEVSDNNEVIKNLPTFPETTGQSPDFSGLNRRELNRTELNINPPIPPLIKFSEFVTMKQSEYDELTIKYGETATKRCIEILNNYKGSNGKKYKSDYRAILSWVIERYTDELSKTGKAQGSKVSDGFLLNQIERLGNNG